MSDLPSQKDSDRLFTPESKGPESLEERAGLYRRRQFHEVIPARDKNAVVSDFPYEGREEFYRSINEQFLGNARIDYLEFGVAGGDSLRAWGRSNSAPGSRFYGFDWFQGLPENWQHDTPAGTFSTEGKLPHITDERIQLIVGKFQETLTDFSAVFERKGRLVLHLDADLYSSTLFALMHMDRHLQQGDVLLFDEFIARNCTDEFAALQDFCVACSRDYELIARRRDFVKVALRLTK